MTIKTTKNILTAVMVGSIIVSILIVVLFETEILIPGIIAKDSQVDFLLLTFMELITICSIPIALRLFKFGFVQKNISSDSAMGLFKWGLVRMFLLCVPMMGNTLLYYISSLNVAYGYMGIICFICLVFVRPTMKRCLAETEKN